MQEYTQRHRHTHMTISKTRKRGANLKTHDAVFGSVSVVFGSCSVS